jgi:hypothetical protein
MCCDVDKKKVRVIFEDLNNSRSKIGFIISRDSEFIEIETDNRRELIPICKIIRIEVIESGY